MPLLAAFPDEEQALSQLLEDQFDGLTVDSVTPPDFTGLLPFARVVCHGGADTRITDVSRITVDYFAATRADAKTGAEAVRQFLTQEGGPGRPFDVITTDSKPQDIPWNDANTPRRFTASYRCPSRRT